MPDTDADDIVDIEQEDDGLALWRSEEGFCLMVMEGWDKAAIHLSQEELNKLFIALKEVCNG